MNAFTQRASVFSSRPKIIKIGGSCLSSIEDIKRIADILIGRISDNEKLVIVVSAMKGDTDRLLELANSISPNVSKEDLDQILSIGERLSSRLLTAELKSKGISTRLIDPDNAVIITDNIHGDANPIIEFTKEKVNDKLVPLLQNGTTIVTGGFFGKSTSGKTTTLGRGGSDSTAVLLGDCLNAEEIVLLKDVDGLLTSDPKKNKNSKLIKKITAEEAFILSCSGAKIIQPKSLKLKPANVPIKVVGNGSIGTVIEGSLKLINHDERPVALLTVLTSNIEAVHGIKNLTMVRDDKSATLIISQEDVSKAIDELNQLIEKGKAKAFTVKENLGLVSIKSSSDTIPKIVNSLEQSGIQIENIISTPSTINILIKFFNTDRTVQLLKEVIR